MKFVFFGTDDFSVAILEKLISDFYYPSLIISQPDKPVGRKQTLTPPPVKHVAETHGLPLLQPVKVREALPALQNLQPDLFIVASFGQIIPQEVLDRAKLGAINVHTSLLPRYRGASPIQAVILAGEHKTGITLMNMDAELDHGPILYQASLEVDERETQSSLRARLATLGADTLCKVLPDYVRGLLKPRAQDHASATFTTLVQKKDARLDWAQSCRALDRAVRAYEDWPWAWTTLPNGKRLQIFFATYRRQADGETLPPPGTIAISDSKISIACSDGWLVPNTVKVEGKEELSAEQFARGYHQWHGQRCV